MLQPSADAPALFIQRRGKAIWKLTLTIVFDKKCNPNSTVAVKVSVSVYMSASSETAT